MRHSLSLLLLSSALLTGCPDGTGPGSLITNGAEVPDRDPDGSWDGDLSEGEAIDVQVIEDHQCAPGTESLNFSGNHVFYETDQPADEDVYVKVSPDPLVDVSLYVLEVGADSTEFPPELVSSVTCDAEYDRENDLNPGEAEAVAVIGGNNPYRLVIGVAGANGATEGGYTVEYWIGE